MCRPSCCRLINMFALLVVVTVLSTTLLLYFDLKYMDYSSKIVLYVKASNPFLSKVQ